MGERTPLAESLRQLRRSAGMTQEELADRSGISVRTITDIERGVVAAPHRETIELLADALDMTAEHRQEWRQARQQTAHDVRVDGTIPRGEFQVRSPPNQIIGREQDIARLTRMIRDSNIQLVSITGPGGVGKTRVALEAAERLASKFQDGIYFIDLTPFRTSESVIPAVADHLGLRINRVSNLPARIASHLQRRELLLIVDNFEHLLDAAPDIAQLVSAGVQSRIVVTSRARLQIHAENELPISTLPLPSANDTQEDPTRYAAIELFIERVKQADHTFELSPENLSLACEICGHLDGLPLAIELAAARARLLSLQDLLPRLQSRLHLLGGGFRDAPNRHRTMRDAIVWSYDLLEPNEQRLFRRLSVFVGGWTLEAAESVNSRDPDTLDGLTTLLDSHLILRHDQANGETRFGMLETIREFGLEQLKTSGERQDVTELHARYFLALAQRAVPDLLGPDPTSRMDEIDRELPNIRLALDWAIQRDQPEFAQELVSAVSWYWMRLRGNISEGRALIERALACSDAPTLARMKALTGAAWIAHMHHDINSGNAYVSEALAISRELGNEWYTAWLLHVAGRIAYFDGDPETAERYALEALVLSQDLEDDWLNAWSLQLLGIASFIAGDLNAARIHLEKSLTTWCEIDDKPGMAALHALLGVVTRLEGDERHALSLFQESLERYRALGATWFAANFIAEVVALAARLGEPVRAARLSGFVEEGWSQTGARPAPFTDSSYQEAQMLLHLTLTSNEFELAHTIGQGMTLSEAIEEALLVGQQTST
jgi:predicted ATPase/DNA-binding XRE family transcriptional regulator